MDLRALLASLRAAAGIARLEIARVGGSGFDITRHTMRGSLAAATVTFTLQTRGWYRARLRLETRDPSLAGVVLRLTRENTPRGQARKYRELVVGDRDIDDFWAIEGEDRELVRRAAPALVALRLYDAEVSVNRGSLDVALRTIEGRRALDLDNIGDAFAAIIELWRKLGSPDAARLPAMATSDESERQAALEGLSDHVAAAVGLYGASPQRVGDHWEARVSLALPGDVELEGIVRVTPAANGTVVVELEAAVSPDAVTARLTRKRTLLGADTIDVDAPEPLRSAGAVIMLMESLTLDAVIAPGRIEVHAEVARADVRRCVEGALELWRVAHER